MSAMRACRTSASPRGIDPLAAAGRLGALLLQFPCSLNSTGKIMSTVRALQQFIEYPLVVEVRHASWNEPELFDRLHNRAWAFATSINRSSDAPSGPSAQVTMPVGYVRLHGRNYEHWFTSGDHPEERYNYLYSLEELKPWAERVANIARSAEVVFVSHQQSLSGKSHCQCSATDQHLCRPPVAMPENLCAHYPQLAAIALPHAAPPEPRQSDLAFDNSPADR